MADLGRADIFWNAVLAIQSIKDGQEAARVLKEQFNLTIADMDEIIAGSDVEKDPTIQKILARMRP